MAVELQAHWAGISVVGQLSYFCRSRKYAATMTITMVRITPGEIGSKELQKHKPGHCNSEELCIPHRCGPRLRGYLEWRRADIVTG